MPKESRTSFNLVEYLKEVVRELKKVDWPTTRHTFSKTSLVIGVTIVLGLYLGGIDYFFTQLLTLITQ